ncbi:MAG: hypothetical protein P5674_12960, partial [Limnospira sp. PMC 289.06]|nr:hypothetical protein [Limnospira sp. PMC 289.06]
PALLRFLQASGHINSYGMVRVRVFFIPPRSESPIRRLFQPLQPYLTPKRLAPMLFTIAQNAWLSESRPSRAGFETHDF